MSVILKCVLASVIAFWAVVSHAEGGWQGIPFGATEKSVIAMGKALGVKVRTPPFRPTGDTKTYSPLEIARYEIGGSQYQVSFFFDTTNKQLESVIVRSNDSDAQLRFSELLKGLTEKYGRPVHESSSETGRAVVWHDRNSRIELSFFQLLGMRNVAITYTPPSSGVSSKL